MKSVCTVESLKPRETSSAHSARRPTRHGARDPWPYAMWQAAFSSKSVFEEHDAGLADPRLAVHERRPRRGTRPRRHRCAICFTHDVGARSPRSPRRHARPRSAPTGHARSGRWTASGIVERTIPSVRRRWGVVKTSSVGMFATWSPAVERLLGSCERARLAIRPTLRSVPGPRKRGVEAALVEACGSFAQAADM